MFLSKPANHYQQRILFTCGREPAYPRNALILSILKKQYDAFAVTSSSLNLPVRYISLYFQLLQILKGKQDLVFAGFLGQPIVPIIRALWHGPLLFDAFLSIYDTLCFDRQTISPTSLPGKIAFWLDRCSCALADRVILDTQAHADYFQETFGITREKLKVVFVGCDENIFFPRPQASPGEVQTVLFYGTYLPLHGIDTIIRAAAILQESALPVRFRLIGDGRDKKAVQELVKQLRLQNVAFLPPVSLNKLPEEIATADICLGGHFGPSEKAGRVIAGKTFQCISMGKPTIVGENPANHEMLTHRRDAWFCEMNSPSALADAIQTLASNPQLRESLGRQAHQTFMQKASTPVIKAQVCQIIDEMLAP